MVEENVIIPTQQLRCEECHKSTDERFKDPKSDKWRCMVCDRAFKANVYGSDWFKNIRENAAFQSLILLTLFIGGLLK
jgi:ribosomal protein L37AE/L43A